MGIANGRISTMMFGCTIRLRHEKTIVKEIRDYKSIWDLYEFVQSEYPMTEKHSFQFYKIFNSKTNV